MAAKENLTSSSSSSPSTPGFVPAFLAVAAALILIAVGAFGFWAYQQGTQPQSEEKAPPATESHEASPSGVGAPAAGSASDSEPEPALPSSEESSEEPPPSLSDLEAIRQAFADKYSRNLEDVSVTITENTGQYANGGVRFAGEISGGWWLAAKVAGAWKIVADGNGSVMCSNIEDYDFPTSMVPECWDEATSQLVTR